MDVGVFGAMGVRVSVGYFVGVGVPVYVRQAIGVTWDAVNVTDQQSSIMRMGSMAASKLLFWS